MSRRARAAFSLPRAAAALRALATALLVVLVSAQVASALHELLVPHRVCAEHGHRVHESAVSEHPFAAPGTAGIPAAIPRGSAESEAHDHCALPARLEHGGLCILPAPIGELARVGDFSRLLAEPEPIRTGASILLVAPKQSPPTI